MEAPTIDTVLPLPTNLDDLPDPDPFYYAVGQKEFYLVRKTMFGKAVIPTKEIPQLEDPPATLWMDIPKIDTKLLGQAWSFFRHIWETKRSEAMIYLTYKDGEYRIFVPKQNASASHVNATLDPSLIENGWRLAGTIHSHCDFGGFHSGTDEADARKHDGIHLTMGEVDKPQPDVAAMIALNGILWDIKDPAKYRDGDLELTEHPAFWNNLVEGHVEPPKKTGAYRGGVTGNYGWYDDDDDWLNWNNRTTDDKIIPYRGPATPPSSVPGPNVLSVIDSAIRSTMSTTDGKDEDDMLLDYAAQLDMEIERLVEALEEIGLTAGFTVGRPLGKPVGLPFWVKSHFTDPNPTTEPTQDSTKHTEPSPQQWLD